MQVKEKPVSKCTSTRKRRKRLFVLLAVLSVLVCIAALTAGVVLSVQNAARLAEKEKQIAALQEQLDSEKGKNDTLGKENDALKGKVESLEKENDALKTAISKKDGVYPAAAYEGKKLVALTFDDGPG